MVFSEVRYYLYNESDEWGVTVAKSNAERQAEYRERHGAGPTLAQRLVAVQSQLEGLMADQIRHQALVKALDRRVQDLEDGIAPLDAVVPQTVPTGLPGGVLSGVPMNEAMQRLVDRAPVKAEIAPVLHPNHPPVDDPQRLAVWVRRYGPVPTQFGELEGA